jgi:hypothetical protein
MLPNLNIREDPEAIFREGWMLCDVGDYEKGLFCLQLAVSKGYFAAPTLAHSRQFDGLRGNAEFRQLLEQAEAGTARAQAAFNAAGGSQLLGVIA